MAVIQRTIMQTIYCVETLIVSNGSTLPIYGSVEKADNYFAVTLGGQRWSNSERLLKIQALVAATKRIDRLNFAGYKADDSQPLQFPRGTDTLVPVDIELACYHLAQTLLKGVDPNTERDNLAATVQGYAGLRSEFDRSFAPPYIAAGIPDATAWDYLLPYLQSRRDLEIRRVS